MRLTGRGTRTWVCPHCFRRIGRTDVVYQCVSGACDGDQRLAAADPLGRAAVCGTCGRSTTRRLCGVCRDRLPEGYLHTRGRLVALAGPVSCGKSTYVGVLVHELLHRLGDEFDAALLPCDDRTMADYRERYERHLYDDRHTVPKTSEHDGGRPLVYQLGRTRRGRWRGRRERTLTLVFLDTAGEHFGSREQMETQLRYLAEADAVVVLVDPQDLPGTGLQAAAGSAAGGRGAPGGSGGSGQGVSAEVLTRVLSHLREAHGTGADRQKIGVPIAVALTKLDLLWPQLPPNSPLHRTRSPGPVFDPDDRSAVHTEVRALLERWQESQLDRRLRESCADYQLFALSMLGAPPRDGTLGPGGVRAHRVEDPLMWLLHRFGLLDQGRR